MQETSGNGNGGGSHLSVPGHRVLHCENEVQHWLDCCTVSLIQAWLVKYCRAVGKGMLHGGQLILQKPGQTAGSSLSLCRMHAWTPQVCECVSNWKQSDEGLHGARETRQRQGT